PVGLDPDPIERAAASDVATAPGLGPIDPNRRALRPRRATPVGDDLEPATHDPVRGYPREMGQGSRRPPARGGESARRIEAGQHDRQAAVLGTPFGVREILRLAEAIRADGADLKALIEGLDDPEAEPFAEERRREFVARAVRIKRLGSEAARKLAA